MPLTDLPALGTVFTQTPGPSFTPEDANCYPSGPVPGAQRAYQPLSNNLGSEGVATFSPTRLSSHFIVFLLYFHCVMKRGLQNEDYEAKITKRGL